MNSREHRQIVGASADAHRGDSIHHARNAMPAAGGEDPLRKAIGEAVDLDAVEPHQPDVAERRRQLAGVLEFLAAVGHHGIAQVEQHAHRHARLHLEHS